MMKEWKLAFEVVRRLGAAGLTLASAESCTGGRVGGAVTGVSGSSAVYKGGIVSYTNEVKHALLGVPGDLLDTLGAVSGPVAEAMAKGAQKALGARVAVSTTGLAGPGGDEFGNPVGTVWIACAWDDRVAAERHLFFGDREQVRSQAVCAALEMILSWAPEP